jgi:hypothetical protein
MLPLKWKIFRILNYIQLIFSIGVIGLTVNSSTKGRSDPDDSIYTYIFLGSFGVIAASSILNIYITGRNFPDKPLSGFSNSFHYVFLVLGLIQNLALLFLLIAGTVDLYNSNDMPPSMVIMLLIFYLIWLINLLVIIYQFQIKPYIRKNYQSSFSNLIDSIGKE